MNACSTMVTVPRILTIKETMKIFEIGRASIDEAIQKEELTAYRPNGRKYLLDANEVLEWIKKKKYHSGYIRE